MKRTIAALLGLALMSPAFGQQGTSFQGQSQQTGSLNSSTTITTGNTFQTVLPALTSTTYPGTPSRRSLTIQNNNTTTDNCWLWVTTGTPSEAKAILLQPGQGYTRYWPYVPSDAIQATCASSSDTLYVDTQ